MSRQHHTLEWRRKDNDDYMQRPRFWQERGRGRGQRGARAANNPSEDCFVVLHTQRYEEEPPALHSPTVLGSFSVDGEKNIRYDNSMIPILSTEYTPDGEFMEVDMDLNTAWHRVNSFTGTSADGFMHLLQWILKNQEKVTAKDSSNRLVADFVCSRRMLKQIMQAPYAHAKHHSAEWVILAKYFKGTVYLTREVKEQEQYKAKEGASSLMEIYGHKFEQYMTGGDPNDTVESDCQFRCVLQLHLNEMSLLFAPDTDAVDLTRHKEDFKDMNSFVRLKARLESTGERMLSNYQRFILNTWWIENKLTGVPRVLVGIRNPEGIVHTLQMLQTDDLPTLAQGHWQPAVCINVLDKFLHFVRQKTIAEPDVVHRFEKSAPSLRHIRHTCVSNLTDILPSWYKQSLFVTQQEKSYHSSDSC